MSNEQPTQITVFIHPETNMQTKKHSIRKRFSQFLSKMFWHLKRKPASSHISTNPNYSASSKKKHGVKSNSIDRYYVRRQYPAQYRTCSMRERASTLSSIEEE